MVDLGLNGKYVVVTGGTHGIGKSIALDLADEGCNVAVFSRTQERVDEMKLCLKNKNVDYICEQVDVFVEEKVKMIMEMIDKKWGRVDILINNVGGGGRWGNEIIEDTPDNVWNEVYYKNSVITFKFVKWVIPYMRKNKWGRVISISSVYGKEAGGRPWFNMAKSAQISLMKTLSKMSYLVKDGITFNTVAPGPIFIQDTGWDKKDPNNKIRCDKIESEIPMERMGTVEEISFVVKFMCSPLNSFMNGSCVVLDGGFSHSF